MRVFEEAPPPTPTPTAAAGSSSSGEATASKSSVAAPLQGFSVFIIGRLSKTKVVGGAIESGRG